MGPVSRVSVPWARACQCVPLVRQRAEELVGAVRAKRLSGVWAKDIAAVFPRFARDEQRNDWQFRQTVGGLQLLLIDVAQSE
ncbi:hypothetical protein CKO40_06430 [Halochromatium glycolicum]|uniref:Uncharacterized protein n=1 Tax=Halochromatium glycolicum TaxID=85075 RepID=A0AAJ0X9G5_9GAMM|nr:hypothetical protein [Halochromatium glycolicum]